MVMSLPQGVLQIAKASLLNPQMPKDYDRAIWVDLIFVQQRPILALAGPKWCNSYKKTKQQRGLTHSLNFHEGNELWNLASVPLFVLIMALPILCKIIPIKYH